jgi:hypothetical protein
MVNIIMSKDAIIVTCDVRCDWHKREPRYRAYVNDELFAERTWVWENVYLEETFQINAKPGKYVIRYELLDGKRATLTATNFRVEHGPAKVSANGEIEIYES